MKRIVLSAAIAFLALFAAVSQEEALSRNSFALTTEIGLLPLDDGQATMADFCIGVSIPIGELIDIDISGMMFLGMDKYTDGVTDQPGYQDYKATAAALIRIVNVDYLIVKIGPSFVYNSFMKETNSPSTVQTTTTTMAFSGRVCLEAPINPIVSVFLNGDVGFLRKSTSIGTFTESGIDVTDPVVILGRIGICHAGFGLRVKL